MSDLISIYTKIKNKNNKNDNKIKDSLIIIKSLFDVNDCFKFKCIIVFDSLFNRLNYLKDMKNKLSISKPEFIYYLTISIFSDNTPYDYEYYLFIKQVTKLIDLEIKRLENSVMKNLRTSYANTSIYK